MWFLGAFTLLFWATVVTGAPQYTALLPATLRPDRDYSVAVSVWNTTGPVEVTVTVSGISHQRGFHSVAKAETLQPGMARVIKLETGDWGPGDYNLTIMGRGAFNFFNETRLVYHHQSYAVLIQTDKAIYKPGSMVSFRAVVINPFLQPVPSVPAIIRIRDGNGNLIEQWQQVTPPNGVLSGQLQLSSEPVLGDWAVHVDIQGQAFNKSFVVAEYILPTYHVKIELPTYVTYAKSDVTAVVKATYDFGKPVRGEVTLTVAPLVRYNYLSVRPLEVYQVKSPLDRTAKLEVNLMRDLQLKTDLFRREIEFFVLVEEEGTGRKYNSSNTLWIYEKDVSLEFVRTADHFKPGLKYTAFIRAAHQDNRPASGPLQLHYGFGGNEENWETTKHTVPPNGILRLEFYPPHQPQLRPLTIKAAFGGQIHSLGTVDPALSPSNHFLQLTLLTDRPRVEQTVTLQINATEPIDSLTYQVMSHGDILHSAVLPVPHQNISQFSFRLTAQMAPAARVVAFYLRPETGEMVADTLNLDVEGAFRTPVGLTVNSKRGEPGQRIVVRVDTRPNSFVGLLATDQRGAAIKTGNDLTESEVLAQVLEFDGGKTTSKHWPPKHQHRAKRAVWAPGSPAAAQLFQDSGVSILTNGLLPSAPPPRFGDDAIYLDEDVLQDPLQPPTELPEGPDIHHKIILRTDLPPTWLWLNTTTGQDGAAVFSLTLPDTLGTWSISAFAVSTSTGVGFSTTPLEVTVYRPFYVTLSLPRSVFRGESVAIQTVVFNNNNRPVQAEISIDNRKGEFEFTSAQDEDVVEGKSLQRKARVVSVPAGQSVPVSFLLTPLHFGSIEIRVTATSSMTSDTVTKKLLVRHEGTPQYFNKAKLVDLRSATSPLLNVSVQPFQNIQRVTLSAAGDILGITVPNRRDLVPLPQGGGEHTMLNLVSSLVTLDHLAQSNQRGGSAWQSCLDDLRSDYQRQLLFRRDDGAFSMFGNKDRSGSTWLSAYALRTLYRVQRYVTVDENVTSSALTWIMSHHQPDGSFVEPGEIHHQIIQEDPTTLTAYVVSSLAQASVHRQYPREMLLSEQFLTRELFSSSHPFVVALAGFALHQLDSPNRDAAYQKLIGLAVTKGDSMYWNTSQGPPLNTTDKQSDYFYLPQSGDVSVASYAVLTAVRRGEVSLVMPLLRWLVEQINERGGFVSTQDTTVGIEALSAAAGLLGRYPVSFNLQYKVNGEGPQTLRVGSDDGLQSTNLLEGTRNVTVDPRGQGMGVMQVSWEYNLRVSGETPPYYLNALLDKTSTEQYLQLSICTYLLRANESTNLAVMEVELPSGYLADVDALPSILQIPRVKRVVTGEGDTAVVVYFDKLDNEESCVTVPAHRTHKVARQKKVPVKIYDYYNRQVSSRMFYLPHQSSLCDICEEDDCGPKCQDLKKSRQEQKEGQKQKSSAWTPQLTEILLGFTFLIIYCGLA